MWVNFRCKFLAEVGQFYARINNLKAFTKDEGNATIKVFNVDRQRFIATAPVKNQCSGSYFYGQDPKLEEAIQSCESEYASRLREIREPGYFLLDDDRWFLRFFWLVQHLRTEAASKRSVEMAAEADLVVGGGSSPFAFGIREAVLMAMEAVGDVAPVIEDLKVCLLRNRTESRSSHRMTPLSHRIAGT